MTSVKKVIMFGFFVWLIPFAVGFALFPIHELNRVLFESIMPVAITASVVTLGYKYLQKAKNPKNSALKLGLIWLLISVIIDLALFLSPSPMQMGILEYIQDIGLTYLIIPLVTLGLDHSMGGSKDNGSH